MRTHIPDVCVWNYNFFIDICFPHCILFYSDIGEVQLIFMHQKKRNMIFCPQYTLDIFLFERGRSTCMTLLISKPTLIAVVLNTCLLRVFHYKRICWQNKNACTIVSVSFLQNAQRSSTLMLRNISKKAKKRQPLWSKYG